VREIVIKDSRYKYLSKKKLPTNLPTVLNHATAGKPPGGILQGIISDGQSETGRVDVDCICRDIALWVAATFPIAASRGLHGRSWGGVALFAFVPVLFGLFLVITGLKKTRLRWFRLVFGLILLAWVISIIYGLKKEDVDFSIKEIPRRKNPPAEGLLKEYRPVNRREGSDNSGADTVLRFMKAKPEGFALHIKFITYLMKVIKQGCLAGFLFYPGEGYT